MQLEESINNYLKLKKLKIIEIIQASFWKKTLILKVKDDRNYYIIKYISENSPLEIKKKFADEVEFYENNSIEFIPKYIYSNNFLIQMEYVDGITLRECIHNNLLTTSIIDNIVNKSIELYDEIPHTKDFEKNQFDNAYLHLNTLCSGGPFQTKTKKISLMNKIINKLIYFVLKFKLKRIVNNLDESKLKYNFVHGDLHYNNIIVKGNNIKIIDFENIFSIQGTYDFDLLYLYTIIEANVQLKEKLIDYMGKIILPKITNNNNDLLKICDIYRTAIHINSKYNRNYKQTLYSKIIVLYREFF